MTDGNYDRILLAEAARPAACGGGGRGAAIFSIPAPSPTLGTTKSSCLGMGLWMRNQLRLTVVTIVMFASTVSACGEGDGTSSRITPAPPVLVVPPPPPPPPPPPTVSGPISLTQMRDFPTLGWIYRFTHTSSTGLDPTGPEHPEGVQAFEFSYLTENQSYEARIPGFERGKLETISLNGSLRNPTGTFNAVLSPNGIDRQAIRLSLPLPTRNTQLELQHTSQAYLSATQPVPGEPTRETKHQGSFVFGVPTMAAQMPRGGQGQYKLISEALTAVPGATTVFEVDARLDLQADFGAGSLTGAMVADVYYDATNWDKLFQVTVAISDVVSSPDRTSFSGRTAVEGSSESGFLEGRFTGPDASEIMVRWLVPFINPITRQRATMFGSSVGKRVAL